MNSVKKPMICYSSSEANTLTFRRLPRDMHIYVASYFSFLELTRLASTCKQFSNIVKNNQEQSSPYVKAILKEVKILKYRDVFECQHLNNISEITFFFKICLKLSTLQIDNIDIFTRGASLNEIVKLHPNCKVEICGMEIDIIKGQNYDNKHLKTLIPPKIYYIDFNNTYFKDIHYLNLKKVHNHSLNLIDLGHSADDIQGLNAMDDE